MYNKYDILKQDFEVIKFKVDCIIMRELEDNTMAKKHGLAKVVLGVGAAAVAGKVAFDKFKQTKERFAKEENDSFDDEIRKYNAIGEKKVIEVEDEVFAGCELKAGWLLRQY